MKSILVALDDTPAALMARTMAIALAKRDAAHLMAIGIVDRPYLTAPEPVPLGASHYKAVRDEALIEQARSRLNGMSEAFELECRQHGLHGAVQRAEADPIAEAVSAAQSHDLILIGNDTWARGEQSGKTTATVEELIKQSPRPVLITPPQADLASPVLIAYDGSAPAARALQIFVLLNMAIHSTLHVVAVHPTDGQPADILGGAQDYLALYGIQAQQHAIVSSANAAEVIVETAGSLQAGVLVMGAFGHRGWREVFFGSCTRRLLETCPTGLFVHH